MNDKEMLEILKEIAECNKDSCKDCKTICTYYSAITSFYEKVLPEGSVVLSKEEYEEYVELRNSEVGELVKENRVLGKQCLDWMKLYHKQLTKTNEARKETAAEIYAIVDEKCDPEFNICDGRLYQVGYQAALRDIKKCLEERFGEEIRK